MVVLALSERCEDSQQAWVEPDYYSSKANGGTRPRLLEAKSIVVKLNIFHSYTMDHALALEIVPAQRATYVDSLFFSNTQPIWDGVPSANGLC